MPGLPAVNYLTKKQVKAFRRAERRRKLKPLKIGVCRISEGSRGGKVEICRGKDGYYMTSSPARRKRLQRPSSDVRALPIRRGWG